MTGNRYRQCKYAMHCLWHTKNESWRHDMTWYGKTMYDMRCARPYHKTRIILHFPHLCIEVYNARNTMWKRLSFSTRRRRVLALERRSRRLRDGKKGGLDFSKAVKDTFLHWPIVMGCNGWLDVWCLITGTWWTAHHQVFLLDLLSYSSAFVWTLFTLNSIFTHSILLATNHKLSS